MGLFDAFSTQPAQNAANAITQGYQSGLAQLGPQYAAGRQALQTNYGAGIAPFTGMIGTSQPGINAYGSALGISGSPADQQRAISNFQSSPGYQFGLNQMIDQIRRSSAASGFGGNADQSGNLSDAILKQANNYANTNFQQYLQNLSPYFSREAAGASGAGTLYGGLGSALNQSYMGQGQAGYGAAVGAGNAQANQALAGQTTSANLINALLQGGKLLGSFV